MGYGKIVATGLCVVFLAGAASAGVVQLGEWTVDQDNYNDTLAPNANYGNSDAKRAAKHRQETTWYGDWSDADLTDLGNQLATLASGGGTYGTDYYVEFRTATNDWGMHGGASFVPEVAAFMSAVDWTETGATNNVASPGVSWATPGYAYVTFWGLPEIMNTAPVVGGWGTASTGGNVSRNTAMLDQALVNALLNDPNCRGLRMEDYIASGWFNDVNMAKERWGGAGAARLVLFFSEPVLPIPEPAGLGLIGLAMLGLRKRRST